MRDPESRVAIKRSDYRPPEFEIQRVELDFEIDAESTRVRSRLSLRRVQPDASSLRLDGADLELQSIAIDGQDLRPDGWRITGETLVVDAPSDQFELETVSLIRPSANTALEGLYASGDFLLTQCEAEGFRKISWYLDRPDVMALFRVRIEADKGRFPVLLSNGDCVEQGDLEGGRHYTVWEDPYPKPCYLFALVAGDLGCLEDTFTTREGRTVDLRVWAEHPNMDKVDHAMDSLKKAMSWDESRFGLSYDLGVYHIVATNDFNMGAMENKSLNIFNSKYVLACPQTATDTDYQAIEGVIGHEYFHNWTGNRVTCRDWFQLSLKEGLTVFRDQEFSSDLQSRAVKRIEDVRALRSMQFPEDAGPMAHPVRPDSYIEINNFYTLTVYEKGAEVVRMIHTLLGEAGFRKGIDLYFERHDGQAVTCDDFRQAMADANSIDLGAFGRWYAQAGTPVVEASGTFDSDQGRYTLTLTQHTPPTPGQDHKQALVIPVRLGLIGRGGEDLPLHLVDGELIGEGDVVVLDQPSEQFVFEDLDQPPVPSLFRGFSAPVIAKVDHSLEHLAFLMARDSDSFNRWDASQQLATRLIFEHLDGGDPEAAVSPVYLEAAAALLADQDADPAPVAEALTPPDEAYLAEQRTPVDVEGIHASRRHLVRSVAAHLQADLEARIERLAPFEYQMDPGSIGRRTLRNRCLRLRTALADDAGFEMARRQWQSANNMTDALAALAALVHGGAPDRDGLLAEFRARWNHDPLVMDKWLTLQALSPQGDTLDRVRELMDDAVFSIRNPNKVRSLIGAFARGNPIHFHAANGVGYRFVADQVMELDALNPQVAARLVGAFNGWTRLDASRCGLMGEQLKRIVTREGLSPDVFEIVSKALAMGESETVS